MDDRTASRGPANDRLASAPVRDDPRGGDGAEKSPVAARQGTTPHVTRYVLSIGLGLAVVAMILAYAFGVF